MSFLYVVFHSLMVDSDQNLSLVINGLKICKIPLFNKEKSFAVSVFCNNPALVPRTFCHPVNIKEEFGDET